MMNIDKLLLLAKTPQDFKDAFYFEGYSDNNRLITEFINTPGCLIRLANEWSAYSFKYKESNFMADDQYSKILEDMLSVLSVDEKEIFLKNEMSKVDEDINKKYQKEKIPLVMVLLKNKFPKTINMLVRHGYELSPVEIKFALYKGLEKDMYISLPQEVCLTESEAGEMVEKTIAKSGDVTGVLSRILYSENNKSALFSYFETQRKRDRTHDYYFFRDNGDISSLESASTLYKQIAKGKIEFLTLLLQSGFELNMKEFALSFNCLVRTLDLKKQKCFMDLLHDYPVEYKKEFFTNVLKFVDFKFLYKGTPVFAQMHNFIEEVMPLFNERDIFNMKNIKMSETGYIVYHFANEEQKKQLSELWDIPNEELSMRVPLSIIKDAQKYTDYTENLYTVFENSLDKRYKEDEHGAINFLITLMSRESSENVYDYLAQVKSRKEKLSLIKNDTVMSSEIIGKPKNRI